MNSKLSREIFNETIANMFAPLTFGTKYLFYVHLIAQCKVEMSSEIDVAGVAFIDGKYELLINPEGFGKYTLKERAAILEHEMHHILNGHCIGLRLKDVKNHKLKNIAFDTAINQNITDLPEVALLPETLEKMINKSVEKNKESEYYYSLLEDFKNSNDSESSNSSDDSSNSDDLDNLQTLDDHSRMENNEVQNGSFDEDLAKDITKKMIDKAVETTTNTSPGAVPSNIEEYIKLYRTKTEVNWKKEIKKVIGSKRLDRIRTFKKRNRRQPDRVELKGVKKEYSHDVLVVFDSSGSVSSKDQMILLNEIKSICEAAKSDVTLIQVDTEACEPEKIKKNTTIFSRKKSGGTFLTPALHKAKERKVKFETLVVCTDGYLMDEDFKSFYDISLTGKKVIWLIDSTGKINEKMTKGSQRAFKLNKREK